jgi:hypothetical protein
MAGMIVRSVASARLDTPEYGFHTRVLYVRQST